MTDKTELIVYDDFRFGMKSLNVWAKLFSSTNLQSWLLESILWWSMVFILVGDIEFELEELFVDRFSMLNDLELSV